MMAQPQPVMGDGLWVMGYGSGVRGYVWQAELGCTGFGAVAKS